METTALKRIPMHYSKFDLKTRKGRLQFLRWKKGRDEGVKKGFSQTDIADRLGFPRGTYGNWEYFDNREIPFDDLMNMAEFYDTTPEWILVGDTGTNTNTNTNIHEQKTENNPSNVFKIAGTPKMDDSLEEKYRRKIEENNRLLEELKKYKKGDN